MRNVASGIATLGNRQHPVSQGSNLARSALLTYSRAATELVMHVLFQNESFISFRNMNHEQQNGKARLGCLGLIGTSRSPAYSSSRSDWLV